MKVFRSTGVFSATPHTPIYGKRKMTESERLEDIIGSYELTRLSGNAAKRKGRDGGVGEKTRVSCVILFKHFFPGDRGGRAAARPTAGPGPGTFPLSEKNTFSSSFLPKGKQILLSGRGVFTFR